MKINEVRGQIAERGRRRRKGGERRRKKKKKRKGQQRIELTAEITRVWEGSEGKAVLAAETRVESGNVSTFFGPQHFFLRVGVGFFFIFFRFERKKKIYI